MESKSLLTQSSLAERHKDLLDQDVYLVSYDIIPKDHPLRKEVAEKLDSKKFSSFKESKAVGAFIAAAVGDALGAHLEGWEISYTRKDVEDFESLNKLIEPDCFRCPIGQFTDDTCQALCIADSLIENGLKFEPRDLRTKFVAWWLAGYNNCLHNAKSKADQYSFGIGNTTKQGFEEFLKNNTERVPEVKGLKNQDSGNGSVMRLVPITIAFHTNPEKGMQYAHDQSFTTHNSEEAAECAKFLIHCAIKLFNSESPEEGRKLLDKIHEGFSSTVDSVDKLARSEQEKFNPELHNERHNRGDEDRNWNWRDPNWKYSPCRTEKNRNLVGIYCMDTACMSLHILYHTSSHKEAMLKAVNLGGDADSVGSIVGMLGGCLYGVDETLLSWYKKYIVPWDDQRVAIRAELLYQMAVDSASKKI